LSHVQFTAAVHRRWQLEWGLQSVHTADPVDDHISSGQISWCCLPRQKPPAGQGAHIPCFRHTVPSLQATHNEDRSFTYPAVHWQSSIDEEPDKEVE